MTTENISISKYQFRKHELKTDTLSVMIVKFCTVCEFLFCFVENIKHLAVAPTKGQMEEVSVLKILRF